MGFKKDFIWGAATAAYQLEGGAFDDGKGLNIWDTFTHRKGKIFEGHNGDTACDHYHHIDEDLDIMKSLGLKSYRFSVSWSRVLPNGTGKVNESGVDFYNHLIDGLIERGIEPCMTLYHWDLPYALHLKGGWLNDNSSDWFEEYAKLIKERFGDRVKNFITFNEPQVFVGCGYYEGSHAPGYKLSKGELLRIGHNVLKAHGKAVSALRKGSECKIGLTSAAGAVMPVSNSEEDIERARSEYFNSDYDGFVFSNSFWYDPAIFGKYPDWVYDYNEIDAPTITDEDMKIINQPIDFIGLNIYNGRYVSAKSGTVTNRAGMPMSLIQWPITPEALYWGPRYYFERYNKPIMITENGMSCHDAVSLDGKVHDPNRIDYLNRYLLELKRAVDDGVKIDGYFVWSLIDNFEWAHGYKERFGIVYCDYETQKRTLKDSAFWYKNVIETNGETL